VALDGRVGQAQTADIFTVPFNDGDGGPASAVNGAATPNAYEYYPDFSADDEFIAFNRVASQGVQGQQIYYRAESEIFVVRSGGGTPVRLAANDPPACSSYSSPGSGNSWAKWSPIVRQSVSDEAYSGRTYYFLTFASTRESPFPLGNNPMLPGQDQPASQLYMATMVVDRDGNVESYPALYLWNQSFITADGATAEPLSMSNLTPAWDEFVVPPIVVVIQ
jgi:hypothetical protein